MNQNLESISNVIFFLLFVVYTVKSQAATEVKKNSTEKQFQKITQKSFLPTPPFVLWLSLYQHCRITDVEICQVVTQ